MPLQPAWQPHGKLAQTRIADFGPPWEADADLSLGNIMRRPSSGELVCSDVIYGTLYGLTDEQQARRDALRRAISVPA